MRLIALFAFWPGMAAAVGMSSQDLCSRPTVTTCDSAT